jgi:hypothetical protein
MNLLHLSFLLLLFATPSNKATLLGFVIDPQGGAIPNAYLAAHCDPMVSPDPANNLPCIKQDVTATADDTGRFSLELEPGLYDIFVAAPGFFPHCEKIKLKDKESKSYQVKLEVSQMFQINTVH